MNTMRWAGVCAVVVWLLASAPAPAVEKENVDKAVQRGVEALRKLQKDDGRWNYAQELGMTSLAALTLLECKVPGNDETIALAAKFVRAHAVDENQTYALSLAILFLDRLGDPVDVALIESLTVRLLGGQTPQGGWGYLCPAPSEAEKERLNKQVKQSAELKGRRELPKGKEGKRTVKDLSPEIQEQLEKLVRDPPTPPVISQGDNSNTQFATLALWVARRQGMPVEAALGRIDRRFRLKQQLNGGWGYEYEGGESTATMTAAAVLCLAIADATANEVKPEKAPARDITKDVNMKKGLQVLGTVIGHPAAKKKQLGQPAQIPQVAGKMYYFLWTLERVAVALNLETIGTKDWYNWGAEILLANQQEDGTWKGEFEMADTCFALLFLRRANLAKDLTVNLKGKLGDPGETTLKTGGVGSQGLKGVVIKAIDEKKDPKNPESKPLPKIDDSTPRGKVAREIVEASGVKQEKLIEKYRDEKGVTYTEALATAIVHLNGEAKGKARDALADRLARMKADTLTSYLKDEEPEIRRAAALACALKESKAHVPLLIDLLSDRQPLVERAALAALKDLTSQNFGPAANATAAERTKAVAAWQEWWKKQQK